MLRKLSSKPSPASKSPRAPRRLRWLVFRLAAVILGLTPLVVAEMLFAMLDWGRPGYEEDPFVSFSAIRPLFVRSGDGTRYEIAPSRQGFFCPQSFAAEKEAKEFRIFCLGGSTVQGRPFAVETSFTTWLEFNLQAADPGRRWKVVNCGGVSYASYRLVPILEEVLGYQPDLIILYTGHNEFLEDRTYRHIKHLPGILARPCRFVAHTRTYTLLCRGLLGRRGGPGGDVVGEHPVLGAETDAMLEYRGGLDQYHRDEKWRRDVIEHFRHNLYRMVRIAQDAGVRTLLVNPVANLRDCPPFKAQHRDGLTAGELRQWKDLCRRARECQPANPSKALDLLEQALEIDDRHAGLHYLLATFYDAMGTMDRARRHYVQAKELDICPLRILEPMHEAILHVADRTGAGLVDVQKLFERRSDVGIPDGFWLLDHVHPSIAGHRLIADAVTEELIRQGVVDPRPNWKRGLDQKARRHVDSLGSLYFAKGQERLEAVRCWTQGKGDRVREPKPDEAVPSEPSRYSAAAGSENASE